MARTGRRPGKQSTREAILTAAREAFAARGFDAASIRQIATSAGVDPALVHHYFGNKDQLFLAAMQAPMDPASIIPDVVALGAEHVGERLVRTLLGIWDSPAGTAGVALVRSAVGNETMARLFREFIMSRILGRVAAELALPPEEAPLRINLVATQVAGLVVARYILKLEPLASASPQHVVALIGPTVQRYITGDLPADPAA